jgi:hypothetical protein
MTLENIYYVGQTVAVFAILISLTFVVLQLRQTQKNQKSLINQGVANRDHEIMQMAQAAGIADMYAKALTTETNFDKTEILRMIIWVRAVIGQMQDVCVQHKDGLIDQDTYDFIAAGVRSVFAVPLARAVWPLTRPSVSPDAANLGDRFLAETPIAEPLDALTDMVREQLSQIWKQQAAQKAPLTSN